VAEVTLTQADLGAAVAAGRISEAQAAGLTALAQTRAGRRAGMAEGDEPFELYRGFNDVFVTIGLIVLLVGLGWVAPYGGLLFIYDAIVLAAVGCIAALMISGFGESSFAFVLVFLGMLVLGLGAGWVRLRAALMRRLPAFPGKHRLPPWAEVPG